MTFGKLLRLSDSALTANFNQAKEIAKILLISNPA